MTRWRKEILIFLRDRESERLPLMKLLDAVRHRFHVRRAARLAVDIASNSEKQVWSRVRKCIFDMDLHEARGYVRVRATAVIRDQMHLTLGRRHNLPERVVAIVAELARERVVHLVLVDFISSRKTGRRVAA